MVRLDSAIGSPANCLDITLRLFPNRNKVVLYCGNVAAYAHQKNWAKKQAAHHQSGRHAGPRAAVTNETLTKKLPAATPPTIASPQIT